MEDLSAKEEPSIYDDLISQGDLGVVIHNLQTKNKQLQLHVASLEEDIQKLCDRITEMKHTQENLSRNISELYKTAKNEIDRKDRLIADLQSRLDDMVFKRNTAPSNFGIKRQREEQKFEEEEVKKPRYDNELDRDYNERDNLPSRHGYFDNKMSDSDQNRNYKSGDSRDELKCRNHVRNEERRPTGDSRDHSSRFDSDRRRRRSNSNDRRDRDCRGRDTIDNRGRDKSNNRARDSSDNRVRDISDNRGRDYRENGVDRRFNRNKDIRGNKFDETRGPRGRNERLRNDRPIRGRDFRNDDREQFTKIMDSKIEPRFSSVESTRSTPEHIIHHKDVLNESREEGEVSDIEVRTNPKNERSMHRKSSIDSEKKKFDKNKVSYDSKDDPSGYKLKSFSVSKFIERQQEKCQKKDVELRTKEKYEKEPEVKFAKEDPPKNGSSLFTKKQRDCKIEQKEKMEYENIKATDFSNIGEGGEKGDNKHVKTSDCKIIKKEKREIKHVEAAECSNIRKETENKDITNEGHKLKFDKDEEKMEKQDIKTADSSVTEKDNFRASECDSIEEDGAKLRKKDSRTSENINIKKGEISGDSKERKTRSVTKKNVKENTGFLEKPKAVKNEKITIISQIVLKEVKVEPSSSGQSAILKAKGLPKPEKLREEQMKTKVSNETSIKTIPKVESRVPRNLTGELNINIEKPKNKERELHSRQTDRVQRKIASLFDTPMKDEKQKTAEEPPAFNLNFGLTHDGDIPALQFEKKPVSKETSSNQSISEVKATSTPVTEFQIFKTNLPGLEKSNSLSSVSVQFQTSNSGTKMKNVEVPRIEKLNALDSEVEIQEKKVLPVEEAIQVDRSIEVKKQYFQDIVNSGQAVVENENMGYGNTTDICNISLDLLNSHISQYKAEDFPNLTVHAENNDMPNLLLTPVNKSKKTPAENKQGTSVKSLNFVEISKESEVSLKYSNEPKTVLSAKEQNVFVTSKEQKAVIISNDPNIAVRSNDKEVVVSSGEKELVYNNSNKPVNNMGVINTSVNTSISPSSGDGRRKRKRCVIKWAE